MSLSCGGGCDAVEGSADAAVIVYGGWWWIVISGCGGKRRKGRDKDDDTRLRLRLATGDSRRAARKGPRVSSPCFQSILLLFPSTHPPHPHPHPHPHHSHHAHPASHATQTNRSRRLGRGPLPPNMGRRGLQLARTGERPRREGERRGGRRADAQGQGAAPAWCLVLQKAQGRATEAHGEPPGAQGRAGTGAGEEYGQVDVSGWRNRRGTEEGRARVLLRAVQAHVQG